jgi:uncharacterized protein (DUF433 family)
MWATLEPWQLPQLQRLAAIDPERAELILNTLWNSFPGLFAELAVSAVDQEMLSVDACAEKLDRPTDEVASELETYRACSINISHAVVIDGSKHVARLAECQVAVWEVVREYRKLGSVARLREAFPAIPEIELAAALRYAEAHPEEIEKQISGYEDMVAKRRAEYPFSK